MIFGKNAKVMLKYQKAKAKLVEYNIPKNDYPKFTLDSNELTYPSTYVISRYSECIIENNIDEIDELRPFLMETAQYYDSAFNSKDWQIYDLDFLLSGAAAYFFNNDYGSAKVLAQKAKQLLLLNTKKPQDFLVSLYSYLLDGKQLPYWLCHNKWLIFDEK